MGGGIGNEDVKTGIVNDSTKGAMCYYYLGPDLGRTRTAVSDVDRWDYLSVVKTLKNERKRIEKRERKGEKILV